MTSAFLTHVAATSVVVTVVTHVAVPAFLSLLSLVLLSLLSLVFLSLLSLMLLSRVLHNNTGVTHGVTHIAVIQVAFTCGGVSHCMLLSILSVTSPSLMLLSLERVYFLKHTLRQ